jgi:hypothetical protein
MRCVFNISIKNYKKKEEIINKRFFIRSNFKNITFSSKNSIYPLGETNVSI